MLKRLVARIYSILLITSRLEDSLPLSFIGAFSGNISAKGKIVCVIREQGDRGPPHFA